MRDFGLPRIEISGANGFDRDDLNACIEACRQVTTTMTGTLRDELRKRHPGI